MPEVMPRMALNAQQRVQLGMLRCLIHCSPPLVLWRVETIAITFSFTRSARASCERSTEEALKRTLRGVPWYRARIAPAVLTRADFNRAKARSTGSIATGMIATIPLAQPSDAFPHGP